jgi:hypothetical protein
MNTETSPATLGTSLHERCGKLFDDYPLAVDHVNHSGSVRSMILMLRDGDGARFCNLIRRADAGLPYYVLHFRHADDSAKIERDGAARPSADTVRAVTDSVPLPRDGSMFGWLSGHAVTALVLSYTNYSPETPEPRWSVLPPAGSPPGDWPPFTGEMFFGPWFWEHLRAGRIASLASLVELQTLAAYEAAGDPGDELAWPESGAAPPSVLAEAASKTLGYEVSVEECEAENGKGAYRIPGLHRGPVRWIDAPVYNVRPAVQP